MGIFSKTSTMIFAAAGLAVAGQAPEFAQQYRQRLGGALEELRVVARDFDRDASNSQLTREKALETLQNSQDKLARDRGVSMDRTIKRFEALEGQKAALEQNGPLLRPINVVTYPDTKIIEDAWSEFEPPIPLTPAGIIWGLIGALFLGGMGAFGARVVRGKPRDSVFYAPRPKRVRSNLVAPPIQFELDDNPVGDRDREVVNV